MSAIASQITGVLMVCLIVCSGANQRKHQSSVIWRPHIGCTRRVVGHSIRIFQPAWTFHMCHVWKTRLQSADALHYHTICELCDKGSNILMAPSHIFDMANLPPCWKSLEQHIRRVNYPTAIWKRALIPDPDVSAPSDGQLEIFIGGKLKSLWF